jgi:putative endonuclease
MDSIWVSGTQDAGSIPAGATIAQAMFFAYVLKSEIADYYYKGHCQNLEVRLSQHNSGKTPSNKRFAPFCIVYSEEFATRAEAVERERYFKSAAGRKFLKERLAT